MLDIVIYQILGSFGGYLKHPKRTGKKNLVSLSLSGLILQIILFKILSVSCYHQNSHCTLCFCFWFLYDISGCRVMLSYNHNYRRFRAVVGFSYKISYFDTCLQYGSSGYPVMLSCNHNYRMISLHLKTQMFK